MHELTEEARVTAPPETVWRDLTVAPLLSEWFWPPRLQAVAEIDLRALGRWEVRSAEAGIAVLAEIISLTPPNELRMRWRWDGEDRATDVEIRLEPAADDATRVIVHHRGFLTEETRADHIEGWSNCLQRLVDRHA